MPELPEVETIRRDLERTLVGERALSFDVFDRRLMRPEEAVKAAERIVGQVWKSFVRKGKYLWVNLSNGWRLVFHLRMTGQLLVDGPKTGSRLRIRFVSGKTLTFVDQRRFGEIWLLSPEEEWRSKAPLGPDALTELKSDAFVRLVKSRTTRIQPLLMDQHLVAGVGNIYAQEALFKACVRPSRPGKKMTEKEASRLYDTLKETLQTAIDYRGSSSRNYRDANGEHGRAQTLHAVYQKGGQPCPQCGHILRAARVGGRGTVFCPQCQK